MAVSLYLIELERENADLRQALDEANAKLSRLENRDYHLAISK